MIDLEKLKNARNNANSFRNMLGIRLTELREGEACGEMAVTPQMENQIHSVAGGCHYALADSTAGAVCAATGIKATTVSADFHYLRPGMNCTKLVCHAAAVKHGRRLNVVSTEIRDQDGRLLSTGIFTFAFLDEPIDYIEQ